MVNIKIKLSLNRTDVGFYLGVYVVSVMLATSMGESCGVILPNHAIWEMT